ncbi:hypothetical protein [Psychromarinibacter halotolerans]|uniref:Uncharacterized protein n=1 Tax=Psychromarinibacter halotolerans TaxID=1775175 RepID=A0ABV7GSV6_9RHOB|nr:hypothetical protein [Psychromarinibacter halotolerans]MDF0595292.1 hypothetical protein [Psychromarinibacter halotolerans]
MADRQAARDALVGEISRYNVYAPPAERVVLEGFIRWDESQSTKTLEELPKIEEWRTWQQKVLRALEKG